MYKKKEQHNKNLVVIDKNLIVSTKRVNNDRTSIFGFNKVSNKQIAPKFLDVRENQSYALIKFKSNSEKTKSYAIRKLLHEPNTTKLHNLKGTSKIKDIKTLDIVSILLKPEKIIMSNLDSKDELNVLKRLKKKLRKHRKRHLGDININTNIKVSDTIFGNNIEILNFMLNGFKKVSRSRRKKLNRIKRKKSEQFKINLKQNYKKQLEKEAFKEKNREFRLLKKKQKKESEFYLAKLKMYEKCTKGFDINPLDLLFAPFEKK